MATRSGTFVRTPNTQNAAWFLDLHSAGRLDLHPAYQRRSVWNLSYRQFFIDSLIRNYPTQSIFVEVDVDPDTGTQYAVIDGKQRLTSLFEFARDEFPTSDSLDDLGLGDKYYSDLDREIRTAILSYTFTVEAIPSTTAAELNQAFDRLNRNVARLNKQELRHAQYGGAFSARMEKLADDEFWDDIRLTTPARRRRMLDVEYVSELYVIGQYGIQDGKDYLDTIYADNDEEIEFTRRADRLFRQTREVIATLNERMPLAATRYSNVADFYALWAALCQIVQTQGPKAIDPDGIATALAEFELEVEAQRTDRSRTYLLAARQGSNKRTNREHRTRTLEQVILGQG